MQSQTAILCIAGPTASGKSSRAIEEALIRGGEVISVDSRQVYRGLDIGTEKILPSEMRGVPHHLIDIREPRDAYSAGDFVEDATRLILEITARGKLPILAGGTHFYFDALLSGLPARVDADHTLRAELEQLPSEELYARIASADARRASELDPHNRRRLIRALEIIRAKGSVPERVKAPSEHYAVEWIVIDPSREELRPRIDARLASAFDRGLIDEVRRVREELAKPALGGSPDASQNEDAFRADTRLDELGLEYKIVGEYLKREVSNTECLTLRQELQQVLSAKLWQYARRQKAWLRKLREEQVTSAASSHPDRS
jgi:tRNA dimethylallyltransferase